MGRLIDIENIDYVRLEDSLHCLEHHKGDEVECVICAPTVEAIPKAEIKKFLEEGTKDVGNNVLAIVREDYIHKAEYETRLKADMAAMLEDLRLDFQEAELAGVLDNKELIFADEVDDLVQQKINALKAESEN